MPLAKLQEQLATLLMEEPARRSFAKSPRAHGRRQGLASRDAALLAGLDPNDLAYFAARRDVDRFVMLQAGLPRTAAAFGARGLLPYLRRYPYALANPMFETARVARWVASAHGPTGFRAEVARFELEQLRLTKLPARAAKPRPRPTRAPGVVPMRFAHRVDRATPGRPGTYHFALLRQPTDVTWFRYGVLEATLVETASGGLTEASWERQAARRAHCPTAAANRAARRLRRVGLLAPRPS